MLHPVVWAFGLFVAALAPGDDARAQAGAPQPPVLTAFRINGSADTVSATAATVALVHTLVGTTPTEYRVSRRSDFAGARWLPYTSVLAIRDWFDETGEACGQRRGSHRVTLYLQMRASVGEEVRIVDGQRQLVPARVESNVLRASICALTPGE
jgi:hypothetical protein